MVKGGSPPFAKAFRIAIAGSALPAPEAFDSALWHDPHGKGYD